MHSKSWFHLIVFPDILDFLNIYVFSTKKIILFFYIIPTILWIMCSYLYIMPLYLLEYVFNIKQSSNK